VTDLAHILNADLCRRVIARHKHPLVFATVSGAHLYGFPSPDSDYDLRGVHLLPARDVLSLRPPDETVTSEGIEEGVEIDLVTHDLSKFVRLMLKRNGYVLEQLLSPLIVHTTPAHAELVALAPGCLTKHHAHHYIGFAHTQWNLFRKENPPRVKPLLYVYRVLLTGIHLMREGVVQANLPQLNSVFALSYIDELIARKTASKEKGTLAEADMAFHESEFNRLLALLHAEHERTSLPDNAASYDALNALIVRLRIGTI
jgi:predicted nucleotidyltransferase